MPDYFLGEFEELVLLSVCAVSEEAYTVPIQQYLEEVAGRTTSFGAVHRTLARLEKKGMVRSWMGPATKRQGGKRKRLYEVTALGKSVLYEMRQLRERMWQGLSVTPGGRIV